MATPLVFNVVHRPGSGLPDDCRVVVELVGENGRRQAGYHSAADRTIEGARHVSVDANFRWEVALVPNSLITPAGTQYKISERVDDVTTIHWVTVTDVAGPLFVEDILEDGPPGPLASNALKAHLEDLVDAHDASAISYAGGGLSATDVDGALDEIAGALAVNAAAFGFLPAATGLVNRAALQTAATWAIAVGRGLYLPPGSYTVEVSIANPGIALPTALRVFSDDSALCAVTFTPALPTFTSHGFLCTATAGTYLFEGMTLHGPTTYVAPHSDQGAGVTWQTASGGGLMHFRDMVVDGQGWDAACNTSGKHDTLFEDCDLSGHEKGISHFESTDTVSTKCVLRNVYIHDCLKSTSVGIYIHPHIQLDVDDACRFENLDRWGVYQNGSPAMANPHTVIRGTYKNCGVAQTTSNGRAYVDATNEGAGASAGSSILVRQDATIRGHFIGAVATITSLGVAAQDIDIDATWQACTVNAITAQGNTTKWRIRGQAELAGGGRVVSQSQTSQVDVDGFVVSGSTTAQAFSVSAGEARFRDVTSFLSGTGDVFAFTGGTALDVTGFRNKGTSSGIIISAVAGVAAGVLTGSDNDFTGSPSTAAVQATNQSKLVRRAGVAPTPIASAASVSTTNPAERCTWDTWLITGNTTINTLTTPEEFGGVIRLVAAAGSAWALGSSGNIVAAAGPRAVNTVVTLMWEPAAAKWLEISARPTETIGIAVGDETTAITTGNAKATFRMPYAFTVTGVRASLTTASSSGIPTFDINEGGSSILSTKLTIDAGEKTSTTAATAAVISDTALADDAEITIDIDVAGTGAAGPKIWLLGYRT